MLIYRFVFDQGTLYSRMESVVSTFRSCVAVPEAENINSVLFGGMRHKFLIFVIVLQVSKNVFATFPLPCKASYKVVLVTLENIFILTGVFST